MIEKIANRICMMLYSREYTRFMRAKNVAKIQETMLLKTIRANQNTEFGAKYNFKNIENYRDFAEDVPLSKYEDYQHYMKEIAAGKKAVLTAEKVKLFEVTSGSGGAKKRIPYTDTLKQEFCCGIKPWIYDIYKNCGGVKNGKSYWSITPVLTQKRYTKGGIPIGFEEDTEYFGRAGGYFVGKTFAVDSDVKFCKDMESFYFKTCKQLLECDHLTLISVWSPTYLLLLTDYMEKNAEKLLGESKKDHIKLQNIKAGRFEKVFTGLRIISCWCDGNAENYIAEIKKRFKGIYIQPKGLLATECFVSFPLMGSKGSFLSIYSHFFEFKSLKNKKIVTADKVKPGERYEVIVTTGGGLYRYQMRDAIKIVGIKRGIPLIRFEGRTERISDLFGEKISEEFVKDIIDNLKIEGFAMAAPEKDRYVLYVSSDMVLDKDDFEKELEKNFHYSYCRKLGQLKRAEVFVIKGNAEKEYTEICRTRGMRLGDIKINALSLEEGWYQCFDGGFL